MSKCEQTNIMEFPTIKAQYPLIRISQMWQKSWKEHQMSRTQVILQVLTACPAVNQIKELTPQTHLLLLLHHQQVHHL